MNNEQKNQTRKTELENSHHPEIVRDDMREFIEWLRETDEIIVVTEEVTHGILNYPPLSSIVKTGRTKRYYLKTSRVSICRS